MRTHRTLLARVPDYFAEFNPLSRDRQHLQGRVGGVPRQRRRGNQRTGQLLSDAGQQDLKFIRVGVRLGPESYVALPSRHLDQPQQPVRGTGNNLDFASAGRDGSRSSTTECGTGINATIAPCSALTPIEQAQFAATNLKYTFSPAQDGVNSSMTGSSGT